MTENQILPDPGSLRGYWIYQTAQYCEGGENSEYKET